MSRPFRISNEQSRQRALEAIAALDLGKPWDVRIERAKTRRSLNQNALLWKWYEVIASDTGNTANDIHDFCKDKFCPPRFVTVMGETRETKSTADLETKEMSRYLDLVGAWAASELGIILPHPADLGRDAA